MKQLIAYQCKKCGRIMSPKHFRCLSCNARDFEEIPVGGECTLLTFTDIWNLPWGIDERSRLIGIVEFENGLKAMGVILADKLKVGMKLKTGWKTVRVIGGERVYGLCFHPTK